MWAESKVKDKVAGRNLNGISYAKIAEINDKMRREVHPNKWATIGHADLIVLAEIVSLCSLEGIQKKQIEGHTFSWISNALLLNCFSLYGKSLPSARTINRIQNKLRDAGLIDYVSVNVSITEKRSYFRITDLYKECEIW